MKSKVSNTRDVVRDLSRLVKYGYTPAYRVLAISGIDVSEEIFISDRIKIVPIANLKDSIQKFSSSPKRIPDTSFRGGSHIADCKFPTTVLRKSIQLHTTSEQPPLYDKILDNELDELSSFLVLHKNLSPMNFHDWIELQEWVPTHREYLSGLSGGGAELNYRMLVPFSVADWKALAPLYTKYIHLSPENRLAIQAALNRIKHSKVRWSPVDRVIDLAVALESILLSSDEDRGLKNKFSNRASWLLKGTEDKYYLTDFFKVLYECRCNAVHNGKVNDFYVLQKEQSVGISVFIEQATDYAIKIFSAVINYGSVPNWEHGSVKSAVEKHVN